MKVIVLGDCASNGSNCLNDQILGKNIETTEYSLEWNEEYHKAITLWYLKDTKTKRGTTTFDNVLDNSIDHLHRKESEISWTSNLDKKLHITNMSKGGATAYGYYKRLLKYQAKEGRPDLILLTDYDPTHPWQRINLDGQKYFFEKGYDPRKPNFERNPRLKSPVIAQKMAFEKSRHYFDSGSNESRNLKIMSWFCRYLSDKRYRYLKIRFYEGFREFENDPDVVDCSDLTKFFYTGIPRGTNGTKKLAVQHEISSRVQKKISELTFNQKHI